ncbi:phage distal tail protein [Spirillospora sp. NPDC048911]|uniref:phage distal tail protein n=1 Tax=Spirillospora sp. NPDC048911 TaxID=3364527 RepID=UPI0037183197
MAAGDLITDDGQLEWNGLLLGGGTPYGWRELAGWDDLPGLDGGSVSRPSRHGRWPGRRLAGERTVTYSCLVRAPREAMSATVRTLRAATAVPPDESEQPLVIRTLDETLLAYAQVAGRILTNDLSYGTGLGRAVVQWACSDPRRYSLTEYTVSIQPPTPGSGFQYPLTYPLDYGTAGSSGGASVVNAGDIATNPTLVITGPCANPVVINQTAQRQLQFGVTLAAEDTLTIDTKRGTVLLGSADRMYTLTAASVPVEDFEFAPGANAIAFRTASSSPGAGLTVSWRDAYL